MPGLPSVSAIQLCRLPVIAHELRPVGIRLQLSYMRVLFKASSARLLVVGRGLVGVDGLAFSATGEEEPGCEGEDGEESDGAD
jgi:hypothetical protein